MKRIDSKDVEFLDEVTARLPGGALIGQVVERDGSCLEVQAFIKGYAQGPSFMIGESGSLCEYSNRVGNHAVGPAITWDSVGNLREERVEDFSDGTLRLLRTWDDQGVLIHCETRSPRQLFADPVTGENQFRPWRDVPPHPDAPGVDGYIEAPLLRGLAFGDSVTYEGNPYTGEAIRVLDSGETELHTFVEGVEDGPFLVWSPSGRLMLQGVHQNPYGPVGPWHEWDEQGRLLCETIYDALGNKIIHRELDENCNIVKQEWFEPTTLMTDSETGEEHPAPWL